MHSQWLTMNYSWFHIKGPWSVRSFNYYLTIPSAHRYIAKGAIFMKSSVPTRKPTAMDIGQTYGRTDTHVDTFPEIEKLNLDWTICEFTFLFYDFSFFVDSEDNQQRRSQGGGQWPPSPQERSNVRTFVAGLLQKTLKKDKK